MSALQRFGLVSAQRFLGHGVARHAEGAGPAAAAYLVVFAGAAFALVFFLGPEFAEPGGGAPQFGKGCVAHVAAVQGQVPAGLQLARMADEAEARAAQTAPGHGIHAESVGRDGHAFLVGALAQDTIIVGRASGLEVHGRGFAEVVEPVQYVFVFARGDDLIDQSGRPTHGHQQEDVPRRRAQTFAQVENVLERSQVVFGDRGVDLKFHAHGLQVFDAPQRGVERAGHAAEGVVTGGVGAVDGDRTTLKTGFLYPAGIFRRDQGSVGGHDAAQPLGRGVGPQFVHVGPHHGVAAGEDDDGIAHLGEGVDEGFGFGRGQFAGVRLGMGLGPAVPAGQVARAGHFPGDETALGRAVGQGAGGMVAEGPAGMAAGMSGGRVGMFGHYRIHPSLRAFSVK